MSLNLVDLVKINILSVGTSTLQLGTAVSSFRGTEALTDGLEYGYSIQQGGAYEVGRGVYDEGAQTFTRGVLFSSDGGVAIDLTTNAALTLPALAADFAAPGEQGPKGDKGDTGDEGPVGPQGPTGLGGPTFDSEEDGIAGTLPGEVFVVDEAGIITVYKNVDGVTATIEWQLASNDALIADVAIITQARNDVLAASAYRTGVARATKAALDALAGPFSEGASAAVYADGTAANNGFYSYTSGAWVKVADLPEVTAAAAAALLTPTYANTLGFAGQGDRTATAVVSDVGTLAFNTGTTQADWSKLIDGVLAGKTPTLFIRAGAVAGKILGVFPKPGQLPWFKIGGTRARQANTVNNGVWEPVIFRGVTFDADGNVVSVAETIAVGPSVTWNVATLEFPATVIPTLPCEGFGWRGVSGTAAGSAVSTGLFQFEAKTLTTDGYGRRVLPPVASPGQTPTISGGGQSILVDPNEPPGRELLNHMWLCNEGHGLTVRDQIGGADFTLVPATANRCDIAGGGSIAWEEGELVLRNAAISTDNTVLAQTIFVVYEADIDVSQYVLAHVTNGVYHHSAQRNVANLPKLKMIHSLGINNPVYNNAATPAMIGFNSGGTSGALMGRGVAATGAVILNALRNTDWSGRIANPLRPLWIATMPGVATSGQAQIVQNLADWHMAKRGRVLTGKYAAKRCAIALFTGESTHHTSLRMDTDPTLAARPDLRKNFYSTFLMAGFANVAGAPMPLQRLSYWRDLVGLGFQLGNESSPGTTGTAGDRNSKMGPAFGFAEKDRHAGTQNEFPVFMFKLAQGSTCIAPIGSPLVAGGTLSATTTFATDAASTVASLSSLVECKGWSKFEAEVRRQGYGVDYCTRFDARLLNDAELLTAAAFAGDPAVPQGWMQSEHDRLKGFIGVTLLPTNALVPHLPIPGAPETYAAQCGQPGVTGYPATPAGQVQLDNLLYGRTAVRQLAAGSSGEIVSVEGDYYGTNIANSDSVHMPLGTIPGVNGTNFTATLVASNTTITVTSVASGTLAVGQAVFGANIPAGATIQALGTGTGGAGTYVLSAAPTAAVTGAALASGLPGMYVYGGDCRRRMSFAAKLTKLYDLT